MPNELDPDFEQDLDVYLNALEKYNINYGPKPQNAGGTGGQNFQTRSSDFAPGFGYVNPQTDELFPLYPDTGGFEQQNPGVPHPEDNQQAEVIKRLPFWEPWRGGGGGPPLGFDFQGKPYYAPYAGGDDGSGIFGLKDQASWMQGDTPWPTVNPGYGQFAGGSE